MPRVRQRGECSNFTAVDGPRRRPRSDRAPSPAASRRRVTHRRSTTRSSSTCARSLRDSATIAAARFADTPGARGSVVDVKRAGAKLAQRVLGCDRVQARTDLQLIEDSARARWERVDAAAATRPPRASLRRAPGTSCSRAAAQASRASATRPAAAARPRPACNVRRSSTYAGARCRDGSVTTALDEPADGRHQLGGATRLQLALGPSTRTSVHARRAGRGRSSTAQPRRRPRSACTRRRCSERSSAAMRSIPRTCSTRRRRVEQLAPCLRTSLVRSTDAQAYEYPHAE